MELLNEQCRFAIVELYEFFFGNVSPSLAQRTVTNNTHAAFCTTGQLRCNSAELQPPVSTSFHNNQYPTFFEANSIFNPLALQVNQLAEEITPELLKYLLSLRLSVPVIARMFNLSVRPLYYIIEKYQLRAGLFPEVELTDDQLDAAVSAVVTVLPNSGHKALYGHFKSNTNGMPASRQRLRESLNRVRAVHNLPPRKTIKRRVYKVKGPLSMLHIDGHHKLIRWRFVVHGGIDGYSRVLTFLKLSRNNKASTVLAHFKEGVAHWGLPAAVRSDHGLENVGVADFMLAARDDERNPYITGRSVHNQRIERMWRDVFEGCLEPFHTAFYELEYRGILDPSNDLDMFCLHTVCWDILTKTVNMFQNGWNNHPVSTAENFSPCQLFVMGLMKLKNSGEYHAGTFQRLFWRAGSLFSISIHCCRSSKGCCDCI